MISYKQWKLLNENFDTDAVLGISRPANLGIAGEALGLTGMMYSKMKKMNGDVPPGLGKPGMGGDEDMGDKGDMGDMGDEHDDDMDHGDEDMGDEDMGDEGDMDHDEDEEGEEDHPHDDTGEDMMPKKKKKPMVPPDMAAGGGPGVGSALGAGGPGVGGMDYMNYMKKEAHDDDDEEEEEEEPEEDMGDEDMGDEKVVDMDEKPACCSKCGKMKKKSKKCCKMTKEDREFYESLRRQLGSVKFKQDQYGYWIPVKEDVLIPPAEQPAEESPGPGEVGFAPQQKIGLVGSNFKEWASHHKQKVKRKK